MAKSSEKSYTLHYGLVLATYWVGYAIVMAYASLYLLDAGFTNSAIGVILAVTSILAALVQNLIASWADKRKSPALRVILFGMALLLMGLLACVMLARPRSKILCLIFYGAVLTLSASVQPIMNALGVDTLNQRKKLSYGISRSCGSIGYGVSSFVMGVITTRFGAVSIPISALIGFAVFGVISVFYPLNKVIPEETNDASRKSASKAQPATLLQFVRLYPWYILFLLGFVLVYVSHSAVNNFTLQISQTKGGEGSMELGTVNAIAVAFEMIPMLVFPWLQRRFRTETLLIVSAVSFCLKCLASYLAPNVITYYAAQSLQMSAWGLSTLFMLLYANQVVRKEDVVKGQAFAVTSYTLGGALGSLLGGRLIDLCGVNTMLLICTILAAIGVLVVCLTIHRASRSAVRAA